MQNSSKKSNNIQDIITSNIQNILDTSITTFKPMMEGVMSNIGDINKKMLSGNISEIKFPKLFKETCNCCPPECDCPPQCIANINRCAAEGERIVVPFLVKNTSSKPKTYRIGVREFKDEDGVLAPAQPKLNKQSVILEPGRSEKVVMLVDLEKFENGKTYATEIVLREKEYNQNICFTLKVNNNCNLITVEPEDEKKYKMHWQSWQSHYYCEPKKASRENIPVIKN